MKKYIGSLVLGLLPLYGCQNNQLKEDLKNNQIEDEEIFKFYNPGNDAVITLTDIISNFSLVSNENNKEIDKNPIYLKINNGDFEKISFDTYDFHSDKIIFITNKYIETLDSGKYNVKAKKKIGGNFYFTEVNFEIK